MAAPHAYAYPATAYEHHRGHSAPVASHPSSPSSEAGPSTYNRHHPRSAHEARPPASVATAAATPATPGSPAPLGLGLVQAIHDFDPAVVPSTLPDDGHTYLRFRAGEVIRVYRKAKTGWWDGELISERTPGDGRSQGPRRGWFPSNYARHIAETSPVVDRRDSAATNASAVSAISESSASVHSRQTSNTSHRSHASQASQASNTSSPSRHLLPPSYRSLLEPNARTLALLEESIHTNKRAHLQPSTGYIISEVRLTLLQLDSLNRDSPTLRTYPALGAVRKVVLVELSKLVSTARESSERQDAFGSAEDRRELEAMLRSARAVLAYLRKFLVLAADIGIEPIPRNSLTRDEMLPAPDASGSTTSAAANDSSLTGQSRIREAFRSRARSVGDLRDARRKASDPTDRPPLPTAPLDSANSSNSGSASSSGPGRPRTPSSATPMSATPSFQSGRVSAMSSRSMRRAQGSIDANSLASSDGHGMNSSWEDQTPVPTPPPQWSNAAHSRDFDRVADVLDAIGSAEDALLSIIAAFIGHIHSHHISSHPSSHANLIEMTRETVDNVRRLLMVVEAVGRNPGIRLARPREVETLRIAKDNLYDIASRLVQGVEAVANAPFEETGEELYDLEKSRLLQSATGTLRAGTDCIRLVKNCLPEDEAMSLSALSRADARSTTDSPRPMQAAAIVLRPQPVGARGVHTLSGLHRKATSLSHLRAKFQMDGQMVQHTPVELDDEDEEVVQDNEDLTVRAGASFPAVGQSSLAGIVDADQAASTSLGSRFLQPSAMPLHAGPSTRPGLSRSLTDAPSPQLHTRSRSTSLSSPVPPRAQRRSPSRSADLDNFTANDYDIHLGPRTPISRTSAGTLQSIISTDTTSSDNLAPLPRTPVDETPQPPSVAKDGLLPTLSDLALSDDTPRRPATARSQTAPLPNANTDVRFWVVAHDYDPREITFNSEGSVIGASLKVLVEKMTPHDGPAEPTFFTTFFYTFRLFTTPLQLFEAMRERYDLHPPASTILGEREKAFWQDKKVVPVRIRVYNFLKVWLDSNWRPEEDNVVLDPLMDFAREKVTRTLPAMAPRLLDSISKRQTQSMTAAKTPNDLGVKASVDNLRVRTNFPSGPAAGGLPPTPVISKSLHNLLQKATGGSANLLKVPITDFDTLELARQLTIMESQLFAAVSPEDLLQTAGGAKAMSRNKGKAGMGRPESLKALSTLSNQITGWVADNILDEIDPKRRASLLKFYIKLADKCLLLNNFSTMFAVLAGLNSSTILRLKKTWDALSAKYRVMMERLRGVIEHTKNHQAYRARLRDAVGPCLPFLGLILTDITFTAEGNPDTRPSVLAPDLVLINQDKYAKLGKIAIDFKRYQEPFNFHELEAVQVFLKRVLAERGSSSLDALYRKSLMLEPRAGGEKLASGVEKPGWLKI